MEAGAQLQQGRDLAADLHPSAVGAEDPGHALEQRALARPVLADQAEGAALLDVEGHAPQGPELLVLGPPAAHECRLQRLIPFVVEAEALADVLDRDRAGHSSSAKRGSSFLKTAMPTTIAAHETPT